MQIRNTINQSVRQMACHKRQKTSLFKLSLETEYWCIDEKNVDKGKGLMVGGKKQSIKPASALLRHSLSVIRAQSRS